MPEDRPNAAQLYRQLAPAVLGYLRSQRVPDPEDCLGDVFLSVARDLGRFAGDDASLRRWVFSIAHNRAMDAHRKASRHRSSTEAERSAPGSGRDGGAASGPSEALDPALVDALASLSPDQREVVVLRFVADLPLEAVARITGRRVGAVKALQHRGLENLRRAVSSEAD
ncbi:MAG TPA: sigma-70 family RNA polymerase sigma factor [Acidimicrobiales bacterium]|nr:sigma-70 family RNA polymerase sigma factor [Acidimicrobiales bacterium]